MKIFLHAGMHKTGTTTIQYTLHANREALLLKQGINYVAQYDRDELRPDHHHFSRDIAEENWNSVERFVRKIEQTTPAGGAAILSSECFHRDAAGAHGWAAYTQPNLGQRRDTYLTNLASALSNFEVEVILFLRRADEYAESVYKTMVLGGHTNDSFDEFLTKRRALFEFDSLISEFKRHFSVVRILPYGPNVMEAFCGAVGITLVDKITNKNPSVDARLIYWITQRAGFRPMAKRRRVKQRAFVRGVDPQQLFGLSKASFWPSKEARERFADGYQFDFSNSFFHAAQHLESHFAELSSIDLKRIDMLWKDFNYARLPVRSAKSQNHVLSSSGAGSPH